MPFKEQNPEAYDDMIKEYGYICPDCGNRENFQQYWHTVKDVCQDPDSGLITHMITNHDSMEGTQPMIADVICAECGSSALICKKGILLDTLYHEELGQHIAKYTHEA